MKPFYFGESERPLFGVHHPPPGRARRTGVVLCAPFGQEHLRAHRALRELASRLAERGFHALRFDLRGCGDSWGEAEEARLSGWREDVATAMSELGEMTGSPRLALFGLRFGATLAVLAAAGKSGGVEALALWDPVTDGTDYLAELFGQNEAWLREHAHGARPEPGEALGFPLPEALAADLRQVRLLEAPACARRVLLLSTDVAEAPPSALWAGAPVDMVERRRLPPAPVWLHAEGVERALVPGDALEAIAAWLEQACT